MEGAYTRRAVPYPARNDDKDRQDKAEIEGNCGVREGVDGEGLQVEKHLHAGSSIDEECLRQEQYQC